MKFLVDAQLSRRMTAWLIAGGCDAIHTLDLPDGNRTTDEQVNDVAALEQRVVVSKDADFVDSHLLRGRPAKLLLLSTGNIIREFGSYSFLELGPVGIIVRG